MKNRSWLDVSENVVLLSSGVGVVAAVATQQLLYAAAPISCSLLLNLANRRRWEQRTEESTAASLTQLDQRLTKDILAVRQQVLSLPNLLDLSGLKKTVLQKNQEAIAALRRDVTRRIEMLEDQGVDQIRKEMSHLQEQYSNLTESLNSVTAYLHRLPAMNRMDGLESSVKQLRTELVHLQSHIQQLMNEPKLNLGPLQEQINHLNRRFNTLPPPFDSSALKQDLDSLIRLVGDLVPRREMTRLITEVEQLQRQHHAADQALAPMRSATNILKRQLDEVVKRLQAAGMFVGTPNRSSPELQAIAELRQQVGTLEKRLEKFSSQKDDMVQQLLDASALQMQMESLETRLVEVEGYMTQAKHQVAQSLQSHSPAPGPNLAGQPVPKYDLVFALQEPQPLTAAPVQGVSGSRSILAEVLQQAQRHLIIVWPWLEAANFDRALVQQLQAFLERRGTIEMGLGHLGDARQRQSRCIEQRDLLRPPQQTFLFQALNQLTQLKRRYPKQFKFKILGTDENFLICDQTLAFLAVQNISTASTVFPALEVGLRTTDPRVVQSLLDRFHQPTIEAGDVMAYFNRAVTRYELGDKQGAIDDYSQVLEINPDDDVASNNRGVALYDLNRKEAALADFEYALRINPTNVMAHANRGLAAAELGDREGALEDYSRAIQLNPELTTAYFYRGMIRGRLGDRSGAIADYTTAIELEPEFAMALFYRGLAYLRLESNQAAIEDLLQAAQLFQTQKHQANYQKALEAVHLIVQQVGKESLKRETLNHPLLQQVTQTPG